ncbi:hypothetical protein, partial [Mesorhizobium sp. M1C.F.Ca.ET.189.01.1.1]|uniref:hypothetical protein n=1 Tax=Mesorhizobium sp. M1C.F.Ca.ET.189.01.1.1 TaxID=2563925 RepID=UPI001AED2EDB
MAASDTGGVQPRHIMADQLPGAALRVGQRRAGELGVFGIDRRAIEGRQDRGPNVEVVDVDLWSLCF